MNAASTPGRTLLTMRPRRRCRRSSGARGARGRPQPPGCPRGRRPACSPTLTQHEKLAPGLRKRWAASRLAAPLPPLALGALAALSRLAIRLLLGCLGLFLGGPRGGARACRLAPVATAAGPASPPRLGRCGLCARLGGRLCHSRRRRWRRRLTRRLLLRSLRQTIFSKRILLRRARSRHPRAARAQQRTRSRHIKTSVLG